MIVGRDYPGDPAALRPARAFTRSEIVRALPDASPDFVDAVVQVVSELMANSILALATSCRLEIGQRADSLAVEVHDDCPGRPVLGPPPDVSALDGRGLHIVDRLASAWGVRTAPLGKATWAQFRLEP